MRRPLHLATFLFACAAIAPACLLDAGPYPESTGGGGPGGGGTGGTPITTSSTTTGNTTTPTGGGGTGGVASICGDGMITAGEQCDDGDTDSGDGCSSGCDIEQGYTCMGEPSVCAPGCGNGKIDAANGEECDDGGNEDGNGCSAACKLEEGYTCMGEPSVCEKTCGNSVLDGAETCDDGNDDPGDGCSAICEREDGWLCNNDPLPSDCFPDCGDGIIVGGEGCDDGDTDGTSKCDEACSKAVDGWECDPVTGGPASCTPLCGDGLAVGGEACDDGNEDPGDGCSAACALEATCGNNIVDPGEECDGEPVGLDECDNNCKLLDPLGAVCKDAPLIPTGSFNVGNGTFEATYQGNSDPGAGGASLLTTDVPSPVGCDTTFNNPVLHRYVTGSRPSFLTLELLEVGGFDNTQLWVYRDCPRKADYEGCDNDGASDNKHSKFTTGYIPAKTTLFIVVSGEGGGGGGDKGVYSLKIIERPVKLFFHEDFSSVTMAGVHNLVPSLSEMTTGDGGWKTCLAAIGNECFGDEPPSHSGGAFGWALSDAATQTTANLLTPVIDLGGLTAARASFAYRINESPASESGKVEPLDGGSVSSGAVTYSPPPSLQGRAVVPLQTSQDAALRFVYEDGSSATAGNFAVDDIHVYGY